MAREHGAAIAGGARSPELDPIARGGIALGGQSFQLGDIRVGRWSIWGRREAQLATGRQHPRLPRTSLRFDLGNARRCPLKHEVGGDVQNSRATLTNSEM